MNPKVKTFKAACYINLFSLLIFLGIAFYEIGLDSSPKITFEDLLGFILLFLIIAVYAVNFYYGIKLTSRFNKELNTRKPNTKIRITFYILELILTILYSIFIYYTIQQVKLWTIWPISFDNISGVIVLLCLYAGYLSSIIRLVLTRSVIKIIAFQEKQFIEQFGKEGH